MRAFVCLGLLPVVDRTHDIIAYCFFALSATLYTTATSTHLTEKLIFYITYKMNDDLKCAQCRKVGDAKLLTCGGCGNVKYCSKEHQVSKSSGVPGWTKNWAPG